VGSEREPVEAFLRTMLNSVPDVGVSVKRQKMVVNFDVEMDGQSVCKIEGGRFPFCGMVVDTRTLEVLKSSEALDCRGVADGLTVEAGARPGYAF
jgi:telomerase reverse transcriptase